MHFLFCAMARSSPSATVAPSCSQLRGMQGALVYRRKFGPRPSSVARAPGGQSHASWNFFTGPLSIELEPSTSMETPNCPFFPMFSPVFRSVAVSEVPQQPRKASEPWYNSSRARQVVPFLTDTNGAFACVCVCVCACHPRILQE